LIEQYNDALVQRRAQAAGRPHLQGETTLSRDRGSSPWVAPSGGLGSVTRLAARLRLPHNVAWAGACQRGTGGVFSDMGYACGCAPTAAELGRRDDTRSDTRDANYAGSKHGARGTDWLRCDSGLWRAGPDRARPDRPAVLRVESPADSGPSLRPMSRRKEPAGGLATDDAGRRAQGRRRRAGPCAGRRGAEPLDSSGAA